MQIESTIAQLTQHRAVFSELLKGVSPEKALWKPQAEKWCLLEIVCHLYDEEREDFRARIASVLNDPSQVLKPIDPPGWVTERKYIEQNYEQVVQQLLDERTASIEWLNGLENPNWKQAYQHNHFGPMSGFYFLSNWLAHDYLHIRQIMKWQYDYLTAHCEDSLEYAGNW